MNKNISTYTALDTYKSRSLGEHYIFYEMLKNRQENSEQYYNLYLSIQRRLTDYMESRANLEEVGDRLISLAYTEFLKEQKYLNEKFGLSLSEFYTLDNPQEFAAVLKLFNITLNFKEVFERNLKRVLTYTNGAKIDVSSFGTTYFSKGMRLSFQKQIDNLIHEINNGADIETAINKYAVAICDDAGIEGINQMFNSVNSIRKDKELSDPRRAFEQFLVDVEQCTSEIQRLSQELYNLYNLDELLFHIKNQLKQIQDTEELINTLEKMKASRGSVGGLYKVIPMDKYKTGYTLEFLREFLRSKIDQSLTKKRHISKSFEMGPRLARADMVTFDYKVEETVEAERLQNLLQNSPVFSDSSDAINFYRNLSKQMNKLTDSWITYESAKNSFMPKFEESKNNFGGFHGGSPRQLEKWGNQIGDIEKIGAIYQTIHGAIGANIPNFEERLISSLAEDIACFLFDDFTKKIGRENITTSNSLHLFNLDNFIVPLSYFLYHLGKAFQGSINPLEIVTIDLEKPNGILFPHAPKDYDGRTGGQAWNDQRFEAINKTKIGFLFFRDFWSLIRQGF